MSLLRIQLSDSSNGASPYTFILNPSFLDLKIGGGSNKLTPLDGGVITQDRYFDSRPFAMSWKNIRADFNGFTAMIASLQQFKNATKYVNFNDADYAVPTLGWTKVTITDVIVEPITGGKIKYNLQVEMHPKV